MLGRYRLVSDFGSVNPGSIPGPPATTHFFPFYPLKRYQKALTFFSLIRAIPYRRLLHPSGIFPSFWIPIY